MLTRFTIAAAAVLLVACGGNGSGSTLAPPVRVLPCGQAQDDGSPAPGATRSLYPAHNKHVVSGDLEVTYEVDMLIDVCEILSDSLPEGTHFLTVSAGQFDLTMDDGTIVLWSADLLPGQYDGPGTYTIDGKLAPSIAQASGLRSAAFLRFTGPTGGEGGFAEYRELIEPCTLVFASEAASGSVTCPKLGLSTDPSRTISWTWTWERLPAAESSRFPPETTTPTPSES